MKIKPLEWERIYPYSNAKSIIGEVCVDPHPSSGFVWFICGRPQKGRSTTAIYAETDAEAAYQEIIKSAIEL